MGNAVNNYYEDFMTLFAILYLSRNMRDARVIADV